MISESLTGGWIIAWRISGARYPALDGTGGQFSSGRWHTRGPGVQIIYCADSLALAVAEIRVHRNDFPESMIATKFLIPAEVIVQAESLQTLPPTWAATPRVSRGMGDDWLRNSNSAVLSVPSAIVPKERNYLLNPKHADFPKIQTQPSEPFALDERLWLGRG